MTKAASRILVSGIFSREHLTFYLKALPAQTGRLSTVYFIAALFPFLRRGGLKKQVLFSWFMIPLVFLSFVPLKQPEYVLGYLPAAALITAVIIADLKPEYLKTAAGGLIAVTQMCVFLLKG